MTELGHAAVESRRQRRPVADVGNLGVDALAFFLDQARGFVEILRPGQRVLVGLDVFTEVDRDDVGTLGGERPRM